LTPLPALPIFGTEVTEMAEEEEPQAPIRIVGPPDGCVTISTEGKLIEVCCGSKSRAGPPDHGVYTFETRGVVDLDELFRQEGVDWRRLKRQVTVEVVD
jgi:hypothetical protein